MIEDQEDSPLIDKIELNNSEVKKDDEKEEKIPSNVKDSTNTEEASSFVNKIKDKVLNKSESTKETPPIDYLHEYNILVQAKEVANYYFNNNNIDTCLDGYIKVKTYLKRSIWT